MIKQLKKQWFFIGIAGMILISFSLPGVGLFVREYKSLDIGIFLAFLITGLTLETSSLVDQLKNGRVLVAALVSSLFVFPGIAYSLGLLFSETGRISPSGFCSLASPR